LKEEKQLILASNSPRRWELLAIGGYSFDIAAAEIDETPYPDENARAYVLRMAESKAKAVLNSLNHDRIVYVLGADTTVVDGEEILGKPENEADATLMLTRLRGRTHQVLTSIAIIRSSDGIGFSSVCSTDVTMRSYLDEEIRQYVKSGDPMDKAGAYAIQHEAFHPVENLRGCYPNVVGLPLCKVVLALTKMGFPAHSDITKECRENMEEPCFVYEQALKGRISPDIL
jgi:septum formation protein